MSVEEILNAAAQLSMAERAMLADTLLASLDDDPAPDLGARWLEMVRERDAQMDANPSAGQDGLLMLETLRKKLVAQ
jgi:hypothetical protein